ncbi:MAG: hypothetical protein OQK12_03140 [Motiliproteus sp.]|nr:hypothetical protein [Motiliproteus sp.]MCW9053514.1 hypothetical protein [Motiliproteus sp.]
MMDRDDNNSTIEALGKRFPSCNASNVSADATNPAIKLYGRRLYKDQTPIEYLAELLLVFSSPKGQSKNADFSFRLPYDETAIYWPEDRIALKLFSFFPSSKLETRHPVHQQAYRGALDSIKDSIEAPDEDKDEIVRLLQSLFGGFVGVAKNRTWVTHSFLPASYSLLSRELAWEHTAALRNPDLKELSSNSWDDAKRHFAADKHLFMARGGELLFLQLAHLFSMDHSEILSQLTESDEYKHLRRTNIAALQNDVEEGINSILKNSVGELDDLANFIEGSLEDFKLHPKKSATLGWVPTTSVIEALLFAIELRNICRSSVGDLEKIELMQLLCSLHVLRSLCFQARRVDSSDQNTEGFAGNYSWIAASPTAKSGSAPRKLAEGSFIAVEEMLYRVLRVTDQLSGGKTQKFNEADKHGFQIFRKLSKEIEFVVPRTGRGQRFVLPPNILRLLVAALLKPNERVRLTEFFDRVFAHFGIALGNQQLAKAIKWHSQGAETPDYAVASDTAWIEEALKQGGFLVELSDAVSIVYNP